MNKLGIIYFTFCLLLTACNENNQLNQELSIDSTQHELSIDSSQEVFQIDTGKIAILPIDTSYTWLFKNKMATTLTDKDLATAEKLLNKCINSTKTLEKNLISNIELSKYKRQYIPFINDKGEKLIWINCFCDIPGSFDYWKTSVVQVNDGGVCFFHLTVNLTTQSFDKLFTNGYG